MGRAEAVGPSKYKVNRAAPLPPLPSPTDPRLSPVATSLRRRRLGVDGRQRDFARVDPGWRGTSIDQNETGPMAQLVYYV